MKLFRYISAFFVVLANSYNLYGTKPIVVLNTNKTPIIGAVVYLNNDNDSTIVDVQITNNRGEVELRYNTEKNISILVSCMGYEPLRISDSKDVDTLYMSENTTFLSEVTVSARRQTLKRKSDRFVFNPGSIKKEVSTSYEVIKQAPLLQVHDDSFSIIGKGNSIVYINGRNPNMETSALVEMLKALPAEQVKSIEIITTPGSTHSASSSKGIINVVLDNPTQGFIGSVTANASYYNERISPSASVWMGYSRKRLNLALSMSYRSNNIHTVNRVC